MCLIIQLRHLAKYLIILKVFKKPEEWKKNFFLAKNLVKDNTFKAHIPYLELSGNLAKIVNFLLQKNIKNL